MPLVRQCKQSKSPFLHLIQKRPFVEANENVEDMAAKAEIAWSRDERLVQSSLLVYSERGVEGRLLPQCYKDARGRRLVL